MPLSGTTINISGGGLCFKSDVEIPMGKMVALEIDLPNTPSTVMAMGKVVWVKTGDDGSYETGVEFWWLGWTGQNNDGNSGTSGPKPGMLT